MNKKIYMCEVLPSERAALLFFPEMEMLELPLNNTNTVDVTEFRF